jgi:hypothetical protein
MVVDVHLSHSHGLLEESHSNDDTAIKLSWEELREGAALAVVGVSVIRVLRAAGSCHPAFISPTAGTRRS